MNTKTSSLLCSVLLTAAPIWLGGCEGDQGPEGPPSPSHVFVLGGVQAEWEYADDTYPGEASFQIQYAPAIPELVELNDIDIPLAYPDMYGYWGWGLHFHKSNLSLAAGDTARLRVIYPRRDGSTATALADIPLPAEFSLTSHQPYSVVVIPVGDDLALSWATSTGADFYLASVFLEYSYYDYYGNLDSSMCWIDSILPGTSVAFAQARLFPDLDDIRAVSSSDGYFYVYAFSGPYGPGEKGNIEGDGMGFVYGWTVGDVVWLSVQGSEYVSRAAAPQHSVFGRFLRAQSKDGPSLLSIQP